MEPAPGQDGANTIGLVPHGPALLVFDNSRTLLYASARAGDIFNGEPPSLGGSHLQEFPRPLQNLCDGAARDGLALENLPLELRPGHFYNCTVIPLRPGANSGPAIIALLEPASESHEYKEKLLQLDRLANLGTLGAMTAHELKNALVTVKTFIDLLIQKTPDAELGELVRREVQRMETLLSSIGHFARGGQSSAALFNVEDVLAHACRLVQPQIRSRELRFEQAFDAGPTSVAGHPGKLLQAVVNLLMNAMDAITAGGVVTLRTRRSAFSADKGETDSLATNPSSGLARAQERLEILVQDSGPGIPPEVASRLFQPFFTTKPQGTGLGLAITRKIARDLNGDISFQSARGQGTTFCLWLPIHA